MTLLRPLFMQAATGDPAFAYTAAELRALTSALVADEGVFSGLRVTQRAAGANMSVDIGSGHCLIQGDDATNQRKYACLSDAVENRAVPAAPPSGTRIHRVIARVKDKLHNGAFTGYEWAIDVLEDGGTGLPAVPPSAISLATVTAAAGQTSVLNSHITNNPPIARVYGVPRAIATDQVTWEAEGPDNGTWIDFTSAEWPRITLTVPPSGAIIVTIGGYVLNTTGPNADAGLSFRISGANTIPPGGYGDRSVLADKRIGIAASRRSYIGGLTPGGTITVIPQWRRFDDGGTGVVSVADGQLIVETVA